MDKAVKMKVATGANGRTFTRQEVKDYMDDPVLRDTSDVAGLAAEFGIPYHCDGIYEAVALFLEKWTDHKRVIYAKHGFTYPMNECFGLEHGPVYTRVVLVEDGRSTQVCAFIDMETGDIYKAASWAKPAKHVRGNVFSPRCGMEALPDDSCSVRYL